MDHVSDRDIASCAFTTIAIRNNDFKKYFSFSLSIKYLQA